jgi:hypothetical protein
VVLSDHGQSQGAMFRQRYGEELADVVARHGGGDVRAEDAERGARFVVTLPACPAPLPVGAAARGYDDAHP